MVSIFEKILLLLDKQKPSKKIKRQDQPPPMFDSDSSEEGGMDYDDDILEMNDMDLDIDEEDARMTVEMLTCPLKHIDE